MIDVIMSSLFTLIKTCKLFRITAHNRLLIAEQLHKAVQGALRQAEFYLMLPNGISLQKKLILADKYKITKLRVRHLLLFTEFLIYYLKK